MDWSQELRQLSELPDDWDGDGAPTPSPLAITTAEGICSTTRGLVGIQSICADAIGGVAIELEPLRKNGNGPSRSASVEVRNHGSVLLVLHDFTNAKANVMHITDVHDALTMAADFLA